MLQHLQQVRKQNPSEENDHGPKLRKRSEDSIEVVHGVNTPLAVPSASTTVIIMNLLVVLIVLMLLFGGGGFYLGGPMVGGGGFGLILLVLLVLFLTGRLGSR